MSAAPILVVDDDPAIRESLTEVLQDEGYAVLTATNGAEALRLLREGARPSVILLDLMMPVQDGYGFRAEQRQDPTLSDIPVIVVTAGVLDHRATAMNANAYVTKPFDLNVLLNAIARHT